MQDIIFTCQNIIRWSVQDGLRLGNVQYCTVALLR